MARGTYVEVVGVWVALLSACSSSGKDVPVANEDSGSPPSAAAALQNPHADASLDSNAARSSTSESQDTQGADSSIVKSGSNGAEETTEAGMPSDGGALASINPEQSDARSGSASDASIGVPPFPAAELPPGAELVPFARSGSRLVALGYVAEEGAVPVFWTLRDTEHGFDCSFQRNEAEEIYCVPNPGTEVLYLDPECAAPLAPAFTPRRPGAGNPRIAIQTGDWLNAVDAEGDPLIVPEQGRLRQYEAVYQVGELVLDVSTLDPEARPEGYFAWDSEQGACVPRDWFRMEVPSLYALEVVQNTELVEGRSTALELEDGLYVERIVSDDGAEISGGLWLGGRRCIVRGPDSCVPVPVADLSFWVDDECTEQSFSFPTLPPSVEQIFGVEENEVFELSLFGARGEVPLFNLVEECTSVDSAHLPPLVTYRKSRNVTDELPALVRKTFSQGGLSPEWLTGTALDSEVPVLIEYIPGYDNTPNTLSIHKEDGGVCMVSHAGELIGIGTGVLEQAECGDSQTEDVPLTLVEL